MSNLKMFLYCFTTSYFEDYDLTLRDQQHLESLKKVSRKTKLSLRNHLTKRYPALPLPSTISAREEGEEEEEKGDIRNQEELEQLDLGERVDMLGRSSIGPNSAIPETNLVSSNRHPF